MSETNRCIPGEGVSLNFMTREFRKLLLLQTSKNIGQFFDFYWHFSPASAVVLTPQQHRNRSCEGLLLGGNRLPLTKCCLGVEQVHHKGTCKFWFNTFLKYLTNVIYEHLKILNVLFCWGFPRDILTLREWSPEWELPKVQSYRKPIQIHERNHPEGETMRVAAVKRDG